MSRPTGLQRPLSTKRLAHRLYVASTGGHLSELVQLAPRLYPTADIETWVTFRSPQSEALLAEQDVVYVRDTPPRDWRSLFANAPAAFQILRQRRVSEVVSNGAGIALAFLPTARAMGIATHYIECAARTDGPSVTGRLLQRVPGVSRYTQYPDLANDAWHFAGSVYDQYEPTESGKRDEVGSLLVTVGTLNFSFLRLFDRLQEIVPEHVDVTIQAGPDAARIRWPGANVSSLMPPDQLTAAMMRADVVIAHSGIGSALNAFAAGKNPILVPRLHEFMEHVDDHQLEIAERFSRDGLATQADASQITWNDIQTAGSRAVGRANRIPRFSLT